MAVLAADGRRLNPVLAAGIALLRADGRRLDAVLTAHLRALLRRLLCGGLLRGGGRGRRGRAALGGALLGHLLHRGGFGGGGLRGIFAAHDGGEVEGLDLRRLVPGMAAAGALKRPALLPQKLGRQLEMGRAVRARNTHSSLAAPRSLNFYSTGNPLMGTKWPVPPSGNPLRNRRIMETVS